MSDVLIYGDTMRSPELRHEVPVPIPDPFLYAEKDERRIVILHSLEIPRVREDAPDLEILPLEKLGSDELFTQGLQGWEVMLELAGAHHRGRLRRPRGRGQGHDRVAWRADGRRSRHGLGPDRAKRADRL